MLNYFNSEKAPKAVGPYSQVVYKNGIYYFSGQIALNEKNEFQGESLEFELRQIFKNIENILTDLNLKKENIIKTTIFMVNLEDFQELNLIYQEFFGEHKPARSTVQVSALPLSARVEIEVVAVD